MPHSPVHNRFTLQNTGPDQTQRPITTKKEQVITLQEIILERTEEGKSVQKLKAFKRHRRATVARLSWNATVYRRI